MKTLFALLLLLRLPTPGHACPADTLGNAPDTLIADGIRVFLWEKPIPDSTRKIPGGIAERSIILVNNARQTAAYRLLIGQQQWANRTVQHRGVDIHPVSVSTLLIEVVTDANRIKRYTLTRGKRYQIYRRASTGLLDLDPID